MTIINSQNEKFIYQVERIEDKEKILSTSENSKFNYAAKVICNPIGIIKNNKINFDMRSYPFLQNKVYLTSNDEYQIIFDTKSNNSIYLGLINEQFSAKFDINKLLTIHSAVLGNTGSGKSTTIRQILNEIEKYDYKNLKIHVFDVHNEYNNLNGSNVINVLEDYQINLDELELQDWVNLIKPSDLVQLPILQRALKLTDALSKQRITRSQLNCFCAYNEYHFNSEGGVAIAKVKYLLQHELTIRHKDEMYLNFGNRLELKKEEEFKADLKKQFEVVGKNGVSIDFDIYLQDKIEQSDYKTSSFKSLKESLNYVFLLEESKGNNRARANSGTMETRLVTIDEHYNKLFKVKEKDNEEHLINVYDVSMLDDDLLLFFSTYLCKKIFNESQHIQLADRDVNVFFLEEAHRYISRSKDNSQLYEIEIFKKIAREGRKFGCFLYLSSQRPSELSSTVLSQCNNYLLHRIKNNIDLEYMSKTIPYITTNQLKRLSFLPTGVTYAVGELFPIPVEIKVNEPPKNTDVTSTPKIRFKNIDNNKCDNS
ncbi:MAG: ATP-binding protein [Chryseobacterium sp.]|nr:ATP-binding protein [Chryseobacterium sp.]